MIIEQRVSTGQFEGFDEDGHNFKRMILNGARFDGGKVAKANFKGAALRFASFRKGSFAGADFSGADLHHADLSGGNFAGANFTGANLLGANLKGADFTGANLTKADFWGVEVEGADFTGADFTGADLTCVDFRGAETGDAIAPEPKVAVPDGAFTTWTKAKDQVLVELRVTERSKAVGSVTHRSTRVQEAEVVALYEISQEKGEWVKSDKQVVRWDDKLVFSIGKVSKPYHYSFNDSSFIPHALDGIITFQNRKDAENWG